MALRKPVVTIANVPLAANAAITWNFITGTSPYQTIMSVHKSQWERLKGYKGNPVVLRIRDSRDVVTEIKDVYILQEAPSDSPNRVSFVVSDKRWKWQYKLVVRDYNIKRKTGNRTARTSVPVETRVETEDFLYMRYSLQADGKRWTARKAVEDVLQILEPSTAGSDSAKWRVEGWPLDDSTGRGDQGEFTLQGVQLRDQGDAALARLLSFIPGADIYVNADGQVVVFDSTDLSLAESHFKRLPPTTWDGDFAAWIKREKIRPKKVIFHYQREVECVFRFEDDYRNQTRASVSRSSAFIENVIPTVDVVTKVRLYDPETNQTSQVDVPAGTYVPVDAWLEAMNSTKPPGAADWNFDTIRKHWVHGDLDGVLGAIGQDRDETVNIAMRVGALKAHFRRTFRINRRYMERVRQLLDVRVALLDPVTGARAPAAVWGEACIIPSDKGKMIKRSGDPSKWKLYRNVLGLADNDAGKPIIECVPGPARVSIVDDELGVFSIDWVESPYGTTSAYIPCLLVGNNGTTPAVITRDLSKQDTEAIASGMQIESGVNGIFLSPRMRLAVMMTIVPCAPNNKKQFHTVSIEARQISSMFRTEYRIQEGDGPDLEVFVPPGELTARFAWKTDNLASNTIQDLLGLLRDDEPGIAGNSLPGYELCNEESQLQPHALSYAAELIAPFADNVQGQVTTQLRQGVAPRVVGNMSGAQLRVSPAPSGKVDVVHSFPGQQKPISRLALLPESARQLILGTLPFK